MEISLRFLLVADPTTWRDIADRFLGVYGKYFAGEILTDDTDRRKLLARKNLANNLQSVHMQNTFLV